MKVALRATLVLLAACSNAGELTDGVIAIQVTSPQPPVIDAGDTTRFKAVPLDQQGDSVGAPVTWMTPDDSTITIIDPLLGTVTNAKPLAADQSQMTGRLKAELNGLSTNFYTLTIVARPDTVVNPADTVLVVTAEELLSSPLLPTLVSFDPAGAVAYPHRIIFTVVSPTFADTTGVQNVALSNKRLVDTVLTGTGDNAGQPIAMVVSRVTGRTAPDTAIVTVTGLTLSGTVVPGSGQHFLVLFE